MYSTKFSWVGKHIRKYYDETDELLNPKAYPTPRKSSLGVAFGPAFFPQQIIFRGLGLILL